MMNKKGFTLVELMVVIVIIGILAAVALPRMNAMTDRARASEVPTMLRAVENAQNAYYAATGKYGDANDIGITLEHTDFFAYHLRNSDEGYVIYAQANMNMGDNIEGGTDDETGTVVASVDHTGARRSHSDFHSLAPNWRNGAGAPVETIPAKDTKPEEETKPEES